MDLTKVLERRADLVLLLENRTILHIEFQSTNDTDMAYRTGSYGILPGQRYQCRIRQVVLYKRFLISPRFTPSVIRI